MRYSAYVAIAVIGTNLWPQTPPARLQFEVTVVRPVPNGQINPRLQEMMRSTWQPGLIPMDDPGRIRLMNWALLDLIAVAYRVRAAQVSGPAWLSDQSFDIEAKVPAGAVQTDLNVMMQSLLEERFGLKVHRDAQTGAGFALMVGKNGPKLKPAGPPPDPQKRLADLQRRTQDDPESGRPRVGLSRANFPSITTGALAFQLARFAEAPVIDQTGLAGNYSVTIETWKNDDVPGGTVFDAVEKLGLKLEPRKLSIETVVVDHVSKTPTAN